ncbi:uncharacterized protein LOC123550260 [Mercenaria mercenaria]|uniref:uncharacterized protein LOC123550260 n=1 Tax=Mercenaria mercenaria TaxID=6596 RepID=UPI00234F4A6D|nr:uncharacterized protein LOC123550260 [Mercenaria mercenaria]
MFELDYDNISDVIVAGIKSQLPFMIGFNGGSVNITVFNKNDKIGVEFALISTTPDIDDIMLQTKSFVTCGTVLIVPGGPDILAVDDSFEVEYPSDMEPVLTGNEEITCPGEESGSSMHAMKVPVITLAVTMSILSVYRF